MDGIRKSHYVHLPKDSNDNILTHNEQKCMKWENYVTCLFQENNRQQSTFTVGYNEYSIGPAIIKSGVETATGQQQIPVKLLKL